MKRRLGLSVLVLCALALCFLMAGGQGSGYNSAQLSTFTTTGSSITIQQNSLMLYHKIIWTDTSVSTCSVTVDSSPDGIAWTTGGIITAQNCAANGSSAVVAATANFLRVTMATLTGAGASVNVQYEGWAYNPVGSSGTISANNGSAGAVATYAAAGGSTTVGPDASMSSNGTGTLTLGVNGTSAGQLTLNGATSGSASLGVTATGGTFTIPVGTATNPSFQAVGSASNTGITNNTSAFCYDSTGVLGSCFVSSGTGLGSGKVLEWSSTTGGSGTFDTGLSRSGVDSVACGNGSAGDSTCAFKAGTYQSNSNCSSSASPAVCGSAAAGSVAVPTGTNATLQVNTTAVTSNSQIFVQSDDTLGTKLGITCNSTLASLIVEPVVSARVNATSFTITISGTTTTNAVCLSYFIVN